MIEQFNDGLEFKFFTTLYLDEALKYAKDRSKARSTISIKIRPVIIIFEISKPDLNHIFNTISHPSPGNFLFRNPSQHSILHRSKTYCISLLLNEQQQVKTEKKSLISMLLSILF